jgi:hypothetical protein
VTRLPSTFAWTCPRLCCCPFTDRYQKLQAVLDIAAPSSAVDAAADTGAVAPVDAVELVALLTPLAKQYVEGANGQEIPGTLALLRALQVWVCGAVVSVGTYGVPCARVNLRGTGAPYGTVCVQCRHHHRWTPKGSVETPHPLVVAPMPLPLLLDRVPWLV